MKRFSFFKIKKYNIYLLVIGLIFGLYFDLYLLKIN